MLLQTKSAVRRGQGCIGRYVAAVALCASIGCGRAEATPERAAARDRAPTIQTQSLSADPCSWLTPAEVSATLRHTLRGVPVRVASAESITPSAAGAGCMYELEPEPGREPGMLSLEVKIDGAEMQAGLGAAAMGKFASAKGEWTAAWDWVSALPAGLFAARQGHVGVLVAINAAALSPSDVEPLAAKVLARVPDLPFAIAPTDPTVSGTDPDPCALVTRVEAEAVLGPLAFAPYRSRESTPIAYGDGSSCTYYASGHHVVVLTPSWSDGRTLFGMMRGLAGLTRQATGERATTTTAGAWDERSTGVAGTLYFLKGDRMLELQHRASRSDEPAALRLASVALGRM